MKKLFISIFFLMLLGSCDHQKAIQECLKCAEGRYWTCHSDLHPIPMCPEGKPICWDSGDEPFCPR